MANVCSCYKTLSIFIFSCFYWCNLWQLQIVSKFVLLYIQCKLYLTVTPGTPPNAAYSVQAQAVLAEILAPLLDVSYGSQEKERVVTLLTNLMYNVTPYLKNHT